VGVRRTVRTLNIPAVLPGIVADHSRDVAVTTPAGVSIDWGILGGLSSSAEYNLSTRDDSRPGVRIAGNTHTAAAELRKVFRAGSIAGLSQDVRTQLSFRSSRTISEVSGSQVGQSSRLVDNGRYSLGFSADSDVSDTMVLSLGASQVVTYDHNFNRRFTQTIFSLILHINFVTAGFR
jgi:hypothetical protein